MIRPGSGESQCLPNLIRVIPKQPISVVILNSIKEYVESHYNHQIFSTRERERERLDALTEDATSQIYIDLAQQTLKGETTRSKSMKYLKKMSDGEN